MLDATHASLGDPALVRCLRRAHGTLARRGRGLLVVGGSTALHAALSDVDLTKLTMREALAAAHDGSC